jgi:ABC-2 type transport system ATP-binding protein
VSGEDDAVVRTQGLTKSYDGFDVVRSLDLVVPRHSIFGFLGPNGAGKTTTMKMLLGLIRPSAGSGRVFGLDITQDSPDIRARIGYLPQDPRFYEHMTARETLRFAVGFFFTGPRAAIERRIEEMLELVGLSDKADRPVKGFSGGERQRLGIAQAQVHEPELLILDEPAASLDPLGRRDVLAILEDFRETTTVFYSTHILDDVERVSDTVCILNKGAIAAQGPITQLLAGSGGVAFSVEVQGDAERAREVLLRQAWVEDATISRGHNSATLRVTVADAESAESQLQRVLLADDALVIKNFTREKADLEDVFVQLIEGGEDDGK